MAGIVIKPRPDIGNDWTIEEIVNDAIPYGWEDIFNDALPELHMISDNLVNNSRNFYPLKKHVFNAFYYTPLANVKCVIIGQDCYPSVATNTRNPRAIGLSFSVDKGDTRPGSLINIYKEIKAEYGDGFNMPNHGDLTYWALQGVLLLNSCLTYDPTVKEADQHVKLGVWNSFIYKVINGIIAYNHNILFVLWGKFAESVWKMVNNKSGKCLISGHPSQLNTSSKMPFRGNMHFKEINKHLSEHGMEPIDWQV